MLGNMKTGTKVLLGFVFAVVVAVAIGVVGYRGITSLGEKLTEVGDVNLPSIQGLFIIMDGISKATIAERGLLNRRLFTDEETRKAQYAFGEKGLEGIKEGLAIYEPLPQVPEEADLWKALKPDLDGWKEEHEKVIAVAKRKEGLLAEAKTQAQLAAQGAGEVLTPELLNERANNSDAIKAIDNELFEAAMGARAHFLKADEVIDQIITTNLKGADAAKVLAKSETASSITLMFVFLGVGALVMLALGAFIARGIGQVLKALFAEAQKLTQAAVAGQLDTRGDPQAVTAEFRPIVEGVNATLDAVIGPLNVAAEYVDRIAKGDIPPKITDKYNGDFNEIKNNLNQAIDAVNALVADVKLLAKAAVEGKLDTRADATKHHGDFQAIVQGVNATLDAVIGPLNVAAEYVDRIAKGDIPPKITDKYNGDFNEIKNNLNQAIDAVNALVADAKLLAKAAVEGKLDTRADATKHQGDYQVIVKGVNDTLDAVIGPLNVAAEYIDRIGKGDIPPKITDKYNGDFNEIKNNLNQAIDAVNALVADAKLLARAAVEGKLATRADATKHQGDFQAIVKGVNDCLDAVIGPLNVAANYVDKISKGDIPTRITDSYNGDFNAIKNNLNQAIDAVNALVADAALLARAAVEGKLATRADATKHQGDFRKIVQGVDDCLDAVIGPLNVAANYVDKISRGDIPPKITDTYNGDFNAIKNNLNTCIDAVNGLVGDAVMLGKAAVEGRLSTRADATKHQGDFRKIVEGVNETLDAVVNPINEAAKVLEQLSQYDLRARVTGTYQGDHAKIKESLNATAVALHDTMAQVAEAVDQLSSASTQIASSSQQVAEGATEQAASLEETSASLEEMSGMTKQNADNTQQAKVLADGTRSAAEKGSAAMTNMVSSMGKIRAASEGTSQIIKDINEIAFQTNLLALNAAVEAARAGDAGRGFAVVAEEVRNLAGRAKEAAKKTEELIKESVHLAEEGESISNTVGGNLREIVESVTKVTNIVAEIAIASQEQTRGIDQVNKAVAEMDKVVQTSAANSEESSSAAEELASQSQELAAMVGKFQLSRSNSGSFAKRPAAKPAAHAQLKRPPAHKADAKHPSNGKSNGGSRKGFDMKAEDIIPLDSDPDFAQF